MGHPNPFHSVSTPQVQAYWDRRPCNIRHSPKPVGTREYFDESEARKYFVEPHIPRFAQFPLWKGKRVLEIGCGLGADTINFARHGARVTAVDLSPASLELARKRAEVYGVKVEFYCADAEHLSSVVPVEPYDLVYSFGVIHHTPHPEAAMAELRKYMHRDSTLKLMVYNRYSWKVLWILLGYGKGAFWQLDQIVARHSEAQQGCPVTYTYSSHALRALLKDFEITEHWVDHIFPYRVEDYRQYRYRKNWYFSWIPQPLFHWIEQRWGWHRCVTARPNLHFSQPPC